MFTVVVIPCYNEEKRLDKDLFSSFMSAHPEIAFYFVDDGSRDGTNEILRELIRQGSARLLSLPENSGKAEAVRQGMLQAYRDYPEAELIGFWDADLATPLEEILRFQTLWKEDSLILMGTRHKHLGSDITRKVIRHGLGRIFATAAALHLKLPVYDTQCGAKLFSRELIPQLMERKFVTRWFFDVEILRRFIKIYGRSTVEKRVTEIALQKWTDIGKSKVNLFRSMIDFIKLLLTKD